MVTLTGAPGDRGDQAGARAGPPAGRWLCGRRPYGRARLDHAAGARGSGGGPAGAPARTWRAFPRSCTSAGSSSCSATTSTRSLRPARACRPRSLSAPVSSPDGAELADQASTLKSEMPPLAFDALRTASQRGCTRGLCALRARRRRRLWQPDRARAQGGVRTHPTRRAGHAGDDLDGPPPPRPGGHTPRRASLGGDAQAGVVTALIPASVLAGRKSGWSPSLRSAGDPRVRGETQPPCAPGFATAIARLPASLPVPDASSAGRSRTEAMWIVGERRFLGGQDPPAEEVGGLGSCYFSGGAF